MKKTLLVLFSVATAQISFGQTLYTEDFSTMTVGNIGTDLTGVTPGQGNYLTTATNGADPTTTNNTDNSNFQVITDASAFGQALQITGPNGDKGNRIMWQEGIDAAWIGRTAGNDIMEVEYNLYTGGATTSLNNMRMYLYDATKTKILAGFTFAVNTKILQGVAYYDATAQGGQMTNYGFYLGTPIQNTPPLPPTQQHVTLPSDSWVRIGMSYNYTTGEVKWKGPGFNPTAAVPGAAPMTNPDELDIVCTSGTNAAAVPPVTNTAASSVLYDNIVARASATDTLLGVAQFNPVAEFSAFPNPVRDFVNISNTVGMNSFQIADLNGRIIKSGNLNNVTESIIDVSGLESGMYLMTVTAEGGTISKKIFKN